MTDYLSRQFGLEGKRALVTGAGRGIGRAVALALAESGAEVAVHYRQSGQEAEGAVDRIRRAGGRGWTVQADLASSEGGRRLVEQVSRRWDGLDVLVNNAGDMVGRSLLQKAGDDWIETVLRVNLHSTLYVTREAIPLLERGSHPSIVNTSSIAAHTGGAGRVSIYAAAKGAIVSLTRGLAKELAPRVRVNAVSPGIILTDLHDRLSRPELLEALARQTPLGRNGLPEECAGAVVFLAGAASSFITGQVIEINGGLWMG